MKWCARRAKLCVYMCACKSREQARTGHNGSQENGSDACCRSLPCKMCWTWHRRHAIKTQKQRNNLCAMFSQHTSSLMILNTQSQEESSIAYLEVLSTKHNQNQTNKMAHHSNLLKILYCSGAKESVIKCHHLSGAAIGARLITKCVTYF